MTSFTRLILALLLIGAAAAATAALRDAGWIAVGDSDGPWGPIPDCAPAAMEIGITPEEALAVGRFLDAMLGHDT